MKYLILFFYLFISCNLSHSDEYMIEENFNRNDSIFMIVDDKLLEVEEEKKHKEYVLDSLKNELENIVLSTKKLKPQNETKKIVKTVYLDTVIYQVDSSFKK